MGGTSLALRALTGDVAGNMKYERVGYSSLTHIHTHILFFSFISISPLFHSFLHRNTEIARFTDPRGWHQKKSNIFLQQRYTPWPFISDIEYKKELKCYEFPILLKFHFFHSSICRKVFINYLCDECLKKRIELLSFASQNIFSFLTQRMRRSL